MNKIASGPDVLAWIMFSQYMISVRCENLNQDTFLVFIDFRKAFDFVQHEFLLHKQRNKDITGSIYHVIKNLFHQPVSCVCVGNWLTDWFPMSTGVRQGDSLSPVLFSIYAASMT